MTLVKLIKSALSASAVFAATTSAWAGCNCNVPPSPAVYPTSSVPWNMAGGQAGMPLGMSPYGYGGAGYQPGGVMGGYPSPAGNLVPGANSVTGLPTANATPTPLNAMGAPGGYGYGASYLPYGGAMTTNGPHWAPGGYEPRIGSPAYYYDPMGGQYVMTGNPYYDHLGPGFQRYAIHGHYRFPYYNYRTPWYYPGRAVYNRNTNFAW